jgi:UDP-N-acetylmuramate--alanine ligase
MTKVHFIGIGGSGLSAIARVLLESGYEVTGSDRALSPMAADLQQAGAAIQIGHNGANVAGADWVVRSSAVPDENPEVQAALAAGIPVYKRADFLGRMMEGKTGIAIAGTHGKTTTTAMITWVLHALGQDPTFIVGGVLNNLHVNAHAGKGRAFVIEADEYDRMFLGLKPKFGIVTNIEHDHPDCYPTPADFRAAFVEFSRLIPQDGALIGCGDDMGAIELMEEAQLNQTRTISYRISNSGRPSGREEVLAYDVVHNTLGGYTFNAALHLGHSHLSISNIQLQVPGLHNVRNALAALTVVGLLDLNLKDASRALSEFTGTGRRFDIRGTADGITVIDDYAHHPTEIRATLEAARARYPQRRIWAVWQPHTYSRAQTLFDEFVLSFPQADQVIVSEIYAAREPKQDFSAAELVQAMSHHAARFIPGLDEIRDDLLKNLKPGDVLLVLSAGDADRVSAEVLAGLKEREGRNG